MADYIPFINSPSDQQLADHFYPDAPIYRLSLEGVSKRKITLPPFEKLWLDPCFDGFHHIIGKLIDPTHIDYKDLSAEDRKAKYMKVHLPGCLVSIPDAWKFNDPAFIKDPDKYFLKTTIETLLDQCLDRKPSWLSVPQLPYTTDTTRHKINKMLAQEAYGWKQRKNFKGLFVLPIIFTHSDQLKGSTAWSAKLKNAQTCLSKSGASIIWTVDKDLDDDKGRETFIPRFNALIRFHEDLKKTLPAVKIVSGPYWGMNLVLWARGLCHYPAICVASSFQYYIPAPPKTTPKNRIAIPPLRRLAVANDTLRTWLDTSLKALDKLDPVYKDMETLRQNFSQIQKEEVAKKQIVSFYHAWYKSIEKVAVPGRALALYQDLSSAYVVGSKFQPIPEGDPRDPGKVAKTLMLSCL